MTQFAAGTGNLKPLNPAWDNTFLDQLAANDLDAIDRYTNASIQEQGGASGHEIRTWVAAYAALSAMGRYEIAFRYYRPIPEFIAGFGITTAAPATAPAEAARSESIHNREHGERSRQ
jgi:2,3-dihydroxyphenylpropionate 1,2-dioxygenase